MIRLMFDPPGLRFQIMQNEAEVQQHWLPAFGLTIEAPPKYKHYAFSCVMRGLHKADVRRQSAQAPRGCPARSPDQVRGGHDRREVGMIMRTLDEVTLDAVAAMKG